MLIKTLRSGAALFAAASLAGCGAGQTTAKPLVTACPSFSLDTPVEKIAANPLGRAVLDHDIPRLMSDSSYVVFEDMSLSQLASISGGRLTQAKLDHIEVDLAKLSAPPC